MRVVAPEPSLVVLSQTFYHPWRAEVDGRSATLWRANHAFQALEMPAGAHDVRFVYADNAFRYGSLVSCLTLAALAALYFQKGLQRTIARTP